MRLHVVARGLSQLKVVGGDSVGRALEKLRDTVGLMRKQQDHRNVYDEEVSLPSMGFKATGVL